MSYCEEFRRAVPVVFNELLQTSRYFEREQEVSNGIAAADADLVKGRTFSEIFIDDLISSFEYNMQDVSEKNVPKDFYHTLLTAKTKKKENPPLRRESDEHLMAALEEKRSAGKELNTQRVPLCIRALIGHAPPQTVAHFANKWLELHQRMLRMVYNEDAHIMEEDFLRHLPSIGAVIQQEINKDIKAKGGQPLSDDGDSDDDDDLAELKKKIKEEPLTEESRKKAEKTLRRLKKIPPMASEYDTQLTYLDTLMSLPWGKNSEIGHDINRAKEVLNEDHYGLRKVKDATLEHLAVQLHTKSNKRKPLCFVGPPGVGKTSIGESIARASGRVYARVALGGLHDEAELRGHRLTYVGAMPGRITQSIINAGVMNPLIMLDEIDKLGGKQFNGDPAAAMLEILDPAQNHTFRDNYLGVALDLSNVQFICTANKIEDIPPPLLDRMEVIALPGYNREEKLQIAKRYLVPKQMKDKGLTAETFSIDDGALDKLISEYTREPGVRQLEMQIARQCRKTVLAIAEGKIQNRSVTIDNLLEYAGKPNIRASIIEQKDGIGIVTGLAYMDEAGGDILPIEAVIRKDGTDEFTILATGQLGDVMDESALNARTVVETRAADFGIDPETLWDKSIHLHALDGATPKDGPSAGAAITTAIVSALSGIPIRRDLAMTGEISLNGKIKAIGGLPQKLQGAVDAGVKIVLVPKDNERDLEEVPDNVKNALTIIKVSTIDDVLKESLTKPLVPFKAADKVSAPEITVSAEPTLMGLLSHYATKIFRGLGEDRSNDNRPDDGKRSACRGGPSPRR